MLNPGLEKVGPLTPYDGVLVVSFGGPEGPDQVLPFLRRVTAGRGIPDDRLREVAAHYGLFGGRSPINDRTRELIDALRAALAQVDVELPVLWGNRNSPPFLADTLREAAGAGHRRLVVVLTSAYASYSSCRQYREDLAAAVTSAGPLATALVIDKIRPYALHPGYAACLADLTTRALRASGPGARLVGVTHSIPESMNATSGPPDGRGEYLRSHQQLLTTVAKAVESQLKRPVDATLAMCSRSGPPQQPWLEPDVNDLLARLADAGAGDVVLLPLGFVADHMEVVYDLDTEAAATAERLGLRLTRVPTVGTDPTFVSMLVDLLAERAAQARGEQPIPAVIPGSTALPAQCAPGCCPNPRSERPALCGAGGSPEGA